MATRPGTHSVDIAQVKRRADIREVWAALGGGRLRRGRGQAFWRGGDGYNITIDPTRGVWFDHVLAMGGDVVDLVETVRLRGFRDAIQWLAGHTGVVPGPESNRRYRDSNSDWSYDLRWARWWGIAAGCLAEQALEELPCCDPQRRGLTKLVAAIRQSGQLLVTEYREWQRRHPELTAGMAHAGRLHDARIQRRLAHWLVRIYGPSE